MNILVAVVLAVLAGPERPIAPLAYGPAFGTQYPYEVASDGTDFLAVWENSDGLYAAAIREDGTPRTNPPHALFPAHSVQLAWAGDAYVLAWAADSKTWFARMNRDAQLISTPVAVADDAAPVAIATLEGRTFIVITRSSQTTGVLLNANGQVVRDAITLPSAARLQDATVSATPGGFVVATVENDVSTTTTARATRFSSTGAYLDSRMLTQVPNGVNRIDSASNGDRVGVAFVGRANQGAHQRLYTFTIDGTTLEATAHVPPIVEGDDAEVVATPDGFAAGMLEYQLNAPLVLSTVPFGTVTRLRTPLDASVPGADLHMASNGRHVLSVWRDFRFSPAYERSTMNLFGIAQDASATQAQTDVLPVAISAVAQGYPSIASAGSSSMIAWIDATKTVRGNVMVRRVDAQGLPLDAQPVNLAQDVTADQKPVVAFTGDVWIVAWHVRMNANGQARSYMRRIAKDGTILDATPIDLGSGVVAGAASNGTLTVLAFGTSVMQLSRAGERIGTTLMPAATWAGGIASNGTEFLVVWEEGSDWWQFPSANLRDVRAMRLDATGKPLDGTAIDVATSEANEMSPIVASDGTDFLVMYGYALDDTSVRAKRVLRTGVLADATSEDPGSFVGEAFESFAVAPREGGYAAMFARADVDTAKIYAVGLDARGAAIELPVLLGASRYANRIPMVAVGGGIAAYTRSDASIDNIPRVYVRGLNNEVGRRRSVRR